MPTAPDSRGEYEPEHFGGLRASVALWRPSAPQASAGKHVSSVSCSRLAQTHRRSIWRFTRIFCESLEKPKFAAFPGSGCATRSPGQIAPTFRQTLHSRRKKKMLQFDFDSTPLCFACVDHAMIHSDLSNACIVTFNHVHYQLRRLHSGDESRLQDFSIRIHERRSTCAMDTPSPL